MGLFLLARRAGSTDFDTRRALDTLPFDAECAVAQASPGNPQRQGSDHYIGEAVGSDCGVKGRAAYRKFMGECLKKTPAQAGGAIAASQYNAGRRNRPPAPPPRGTRF